MARTEQHRCIVLRSHDVGEADRFCILLTEERGRLAARARGVRKLKSRMGGSLLTLQETDVTLRESSAGFHISDAHCVHDYSSRLQLNAFLCATEAVELILSLVEDDHAVPDIYDVLRTFLEGCVRGDVRSALPFTVRLLQTMGVLPAQETHQVFLHLSGEERRFIGDCSRRQWRSLQPPSGVNHRHLALLCGRIMEQQTNRQFRTAAVAQAIAGAAAPNAGGSA